VSTVAPTPVSHASDRLGGVLAEERYLRERLRPSLRDRDYLILTDVLQVVREFAAHVEGSLFDYGSGGAPYRELFVRCPTYIRADVLPGPKVDRLVAFDGSTGEANASYDAVLSTQVLEHVAEPAAYLRECARLLKPGGRLLVTTHGMFEEHGCPYDFTRWTVTGLEKLARDCGFEIVASFKITTQARGCLQLENCFSETLRAPGRPVADRFWKIVRKLIRVGLTPVLNFIGSLLRKQGVVPGNNPAWVYVGIGVHARRPPIAADAR
jgi:SAM-dependent methyltransferase